MARSIKGGIKRSETDPASDQFPKCLHSLEHTKRFTELGREEKEEGGDRGDLVEKKDCPKRMRQLDGITDAMDVNLGKLQEMVKS